WDDRWCVDISTELAQIIDESWAREQAIPPYHIYAKIAYHLSHEAREGLAEFRIPADFGNLLFEFQKAAVKIAAHHLKKRGGVVIDESHSLRNREGHRYRAIQDYIRTSVSRCILLSATPYNKSYIDLGNQLRLFTPEDKDVGIRPERLLQDMGETEAARQTEF